jgi:peroxisomal membrane protein 2
VVERLFAGAPATAATAARKVLLDQLTFGPVSNIAFMTFFALAVAPASAAKGVGVARRVRDDLPRVQLLAWRFWPLVAAFNYQAVPPPLRPLAANVAGLVWSTFLAVSARRKAAPKAIKAA